jgi:hypothetical protein
MLESDVKITFPIGNWDKLREWLEDGTTPLSASVVRYLLAERDAFLNGLLYAIADERKRIVNGLKQELERKPVSWASDTIQIGFQDGIEHAIAFVRGDTDAAY